MTNDEREGVIDSEGTGLSPSEQASYFNYRNRQRDFWENESRMQEKLKDSKYVRKEVAKFGLVALLSLSIFGAAIYGYYQLSKSKNYPSYQEYRYLNESKTPMRKK
jgi:hypothetical protein